MVKHSAANLTYYYCDVLTKFGIDPVRMETLVALRGAFVQPIWAEV